MNDIADFLRGRYTEEKAEAEKQADDYPLDPWAIQWEETGEWNSYSYVRIAKARILAEVDAKRELLRLATQAHTNASLPPEGPLGPSGAGLYVNGSPPRWSTRSSCSPCPTPITPTTARSGGHE